MAVFGHQVAKTMAVDSQRLAVTNMPWNSGYTGKHPETVDKHTYMFTLPRHHVLGGLDLQDSQVSRSDLRFIDGKRIVEPL